MPATAAAPPPTAGIAAVALAFAAVSPMGVTTLALAAFAARAAIVVAMPAAAPASIAPAAATAVAVFALAAFMAGTRFFGARLGRRFAAKEALEPAKEATGLFLGGCRRGAFLVRLIRARLELPRLAPGGIARLALLERTRFALFPRFALLE
jgi:hypothetical protein